MTPSVADKTPIPAKVWRRHTDPPGLWIFVVVSSVSLHLLVFWLMRLSNAFSLWFPQQNQSAVPIELIEIAPKTKSIIKSKSTAKIVSSKPLSSTQKSVPTRSSQTARTTPKNEDFGAINSPENLQKKSRIYASQPNSQPFRKQIVPTPTPKPTPKATPKPIAKATTKPTPKATPKPIAKVTPTPTVPVGNLPWKRRQEIKLGKGTQLPTGIPSNRPVSEPENRETPATSTRETPATSTRETPATSTRETPATSTGGASVAIVAPLSRNQVISLIQSRGFRQDALPDVIALYRGSNTKQLDPSFLVHNSGLEAAQLLASLIIDNNGNFKQAVVLEIEPATLQSEKSTYEQVLNEVFKTENFLAAHNNDGTKPELSNLYVRIRIQPANSN
ncbi:hypothetical protein [Nostoc sp. 'Lobaria pulmonaria (5183) cyanobiont']|uniref:hypothetical protein n=1 Tax=Nostoc sp. 'Lobaria pulmonaria (5183) cyanobiont' TaxID=1618022 RepID=UPI000CF33BD1|nr:hypothetical protein [Nostoc sp. 'Lobaria pulmonaria (5183) cyanobiont']AVH74127.1 hypothetical protein NLP_5868 [Nostoc sp. 'Lobaria pulmonaria (5183) cyanobiont']